MLDTLAVALPRFEAVGMADMAHIFGFDDVGDNVHAATVDIYGEIKERWPWLPSMTRRSAAGLRARGHEMRRLRTWNAVPSSYEGYIVIQATTWNLKFEACN